MPYTASNVPSYVPKDKAKAWAETWNAAYESKLKSGASKDKAEQYAFAVASGKHGPNSKAEEAQGMDTFRKFMQLMKVDEETHTTWGIVTAETPDCENEICSYADAKKAYKQWSDDVYKRTVAAGQDPSLGNVRVMHGLEIGGKVIKLEFKDDEKQVWVGTQPADDNVWKLIKGGYITGLSQGGKYLWKKKEGDFTRYAPTISEISYVDLPCLKEASFAYVKADGSTELVKFAKEPPSDPELVKLLKGSEPALPSEPGVIPSATVDTNAVSVALLDNKRYEDDTQATKCSCKCENCEKGECANCLADTKCQMCMTAAMKAVKYLVSSGGEQHLPYTDDSGKPSRRLCGAAWAALHGGYRGNKYEGPNKEGAKRKLKQIYSSNGWPTPTEKAEQLGELIKTHLEDAIASHLYGFEKGMYNVSTFAEIIHALKFLCITIEDEGNREGGDEIDFAVSGALLSALDNLLDSFASYVTNQIEEIRQEHLA